jgi:hypothetical protein
VDPNEILNQFGSRAGRVLLKQADLEEKFNTICVEDGVKMTPLEE